MQTKISHYAAEDREQCDRFLGVYKNETDPETRLTMLESVFGHLLKEQLLLLGYVPHIFAGTLRGKCTICGQGELHVIHHPMFVYFGSVEK